MIAKNSKLFFIGIFCLCFNNFASKGNNLKVGRGFYYNNVYFNDPVLNSRQSANLYNYYSNLTENLGDNPSNLCVSVACAMVASYYDTYYNDGIIYDYYDIQSECFNDDFDCFSTTNSPGVYSKISSYCLNLDGSINANLLTNYCNNYPDYVLCEVGYGLMSNNGVLDFAPTSYPRSFITSFFDGLNNDENITASFNSMVLLGENLSLEFEMIKDAIDNGYPTIATISGGVYNHEVVVFAYDENDNFYYHNGYKEDNNYNFSYLGVTTSFIECFIIEIEDGYSHICSNNYYSIDPITEEVTYYCPCMLNGMSYPNHVHSVSHNVDYDFDEDDELLFDVTHYETCSSSNLTKTVSCDIYYISQTQNSNHSIHFSCGNTSIENHFVIDIAPITCDHHYLMCICGVFDYEHHFDIIVYINNIAFHFCVCGILFDDEQNELYIELLRDYLYNHDYDEYFIDNLIDYINDYLSN